MEHRLNDRLVSMTEPRLCAVLVAGTNLLSPTFAKDRRNSMKKPYTELPTTGPAEFGPEPQEVLTTTEARQASPRKMNLVVLIVSLSLAVVAAIGLYAIFYAGDTSMSTPDPAPTEQTAPGP